MSQGTKTNNKAVKQNLQDAPTAGPRLDRLRRYVTWSEADLAEFSEALAYQRMIEADIWWPGQEIQPVRTNDDDAAMRLDAP